MATDPFDLNLRHLRALLAIREHGSITAAADVVSLSQPALTQGLAKLERQFGYTFFERRSGGMVPTPMGEIVIERARAALDHLSQAAKGLSGVFQYPERLMTMTQLRAFLALAEAGSFAAAAHGSTLSQTAVHRAVGDLEQMIGGKLVERRGRAVWLNPAGKRLARGTRLAVAEIVAALADMGLDSGSGSEVIAFGALPLARPYLVPAAMARMARSDPRAAFKVLEGSWRELVEPLRDGVIDMIVGALRPYEIADLYQLPLSEDRLVIAAGSQHPLAAEARPTMAQLARYPWIVAPANSPLREQWEKLFGEGVAPAVAPPATPIECGSVMIIGRLLTEGHFLTLLSPDQVALQIRSGLLTQIGPPLEDSKRVVGITTRRSWRPTATQRRFLEMVSEAAKGERVEGAPPDLRESGWV
ncbi:MULTISPECIES: LysR family transcriptional regulator [Sphingobium]|uniref:LysR family transcriptional regulator n=4 Tax=Sphingobium TaxID=165695 RepID=A0A0J7Y1A9_9SPHN|nr:MULTISPECIES: LysR family transcriptional regulator [Sphingobium]KMS57706.1 LysR family transcriptional regulator [Sphingobium cupriresistens LL01]RYM10900.1 LysR family transcriptional regulator [Sphingobium cupriresistens]WCP14788.1 HTH-type transcriptional regulator HdfR [Sphingobium sp. AntQ-1]